MTLPTSDPTSRTNIDRNPSTEGEIQKRIGTKSSLKEVLFLRNLPKHKGTKGIHFPFHRAYPVTKLQSFLPPTTPPQQNIKVFHKETPTPSNCNRRKKKN